MFKSLKTILGGVKTPPMSLEDEVLNTYPKEVLEIHHEFKIASEKMLAQANEIIANTTVNKTKVELLQSLGFGQAREVLESSDKIKVLDLSTKQIELVRRYAIEYPSYKFITEKQVKHICHKYGLVFGDVSDYKGFVPEKNLKEIEQFLKIYNKKEQYTHVVDLYPYSGESMLNVPLTLELSIDQGYHLCQVKGTDRLLQQPVFVEAMKGNYYGNLTLPDGHDFSGKVNIKKIAMKIAAPLKDMDMSGKTIENGYQVVEIKKEIPDPVVFHHVEGGYIISTMWADEQFDPHTEPMLRNDTFNN